MSCARGSVHRDRPNARGGPTVFALCAVDALGIPVMLGQAANIASRCAHCQTPVEVAVTPGGLGRHHPRESLMWFPLAAEVCRPVAQSRCPDINFFCSPEHLDTWWLARGRPEGLSMTMAEAFEAGREIFGSLLTSPEPKAR
ncbi:MAG: alkylmercury lyase family protein [Candidatus Methylomirabilales bacterium]